MQDYHGYCLSIFGALMFGILQGVCVVLADTNTVTVYRATGSSLDLTLKYPNESVSAVQWLYNEKQFAEYSQSQYSHQNSQFTGRLKEDNDKVGVILQDLQPQDSGTFSVVVDGTKEQYPTQTFTVYIQNSITAVQIEKNQTWKVATNSCDVDVTCAALGAESVSYMWSGYKTASGAQLQFSLSPAEGDVTLNCTAANNVSSSSAAETLSCPESKELENSTITGESQLVWIIIAGAAFILLIAVTAALSCWWRSQKGGSIAEGGTTVYADVNTGAIAQKDKRSDSITNGMTVYETVDDLRMTPEMTIYSKVTLPQHTKVSATSSSPYQQVC
ncbi:SLAM family member 8 [Pangasianodon hypophthalmus]|uniref:SLAM family member 8 n=1 Tax=Pangasianodon hypophthalmus TaxID=310915 RepID=UPI0023080B8E|nr:SLAM family member 8 [Pangasianodon hypophthalmus]